MMIVRIILQIWALSNGNTHVLNITVPNRSYYVTIWPPSLWHRHWSDPPDEVVGDA